MKEKMVKKSIKEIKSVSSNKSFVPVKPKKISKPELESRMLENFIGLQKVLTNQAIKFEALSDQISKLLELFEISAKNFVERTNDLGFGNKKDDKELIDKLDLLLDQNKTIARGLTLMEEKLRERRQDHSPPNYGEGRPKPPTF